MQWTVEFVRWIDAGTVEWVPALDGSAPLQASVPVITSLPASA